MYELMAASRPMVVLKLGQKQDDAAAFDHWLGQLRRLKADLEARFAVRITDTRLEGAMISSSPCLAILPSVREEA